MKYLDEEDQEKLNELGKKISQAKELMQEIKGFFVEKEGNLEKYYGTQELLDIIHLYIDGESPKYIGEQVWQDDGESVKDVLKTMNIHCDDVSCSQEDNTDYLGEQEFMDSEKARSMDSENVV